MPNSPPHVDGLVDLRGSTTTVVDPKVALGVDTRTEGSRILVLETESGERVGWLVDSAEEVLDVSLGAVEADLSDETVVGVFERGGGFRIWLDPSARLLTV